MTRCFIAVDIDDALRQRIVNLQREIEPLIIGKIVEPENLHFTLKFLGEISDKQIDDVKKVLSDIASNFQPFTIDLVGVGAFPNKNYVKIVWAGAPKLFNLQKPIADSLESFGKDHDVIPHLTLARVKNVKNKNDLAGFMKRHENTVFGTMAISNIKLKKSILAPTGPVYEDVAVFGLQ